MDAMAVYDVTKGKSVEKTRGPRTEAWGTPWEIEALLELDLLILMNWRWWERYDLNQEKAVPDMQAEDWSQERRMEWLVVLNVAVSTEAVGIRGEEEVICDFY